MNKLIKIAASQLGVHEIKGNEDNPIIINYANESGINNYSHDEIPWCSIFINWCCKKAGYEYSGKANARSWLKVGEKVDIPKPGDIVIFWRKSPESIFGHVAFFLGYRNDMKRIFVIGGNQGNAVSISEYNADRILEFRRLREISASLFPIPNLKIGDNGNEVIKLQNILNKLNYDCGNADGLFGVKTEKALKQFQKDTNLKDDGVYGNETRKILEGFINGKS